VTVPVLDGRRLPRGSRPRELRKVRHRQGGLVQIPGAQYHAHPAVQLVKAELTERIVLAEHGDQPFPAGVISQPPGTAGRGTGHS